MDSENTDCEAKPAEGARVDHESTRVYQRMRPLLMSMRLLGSYHHRKFYADTKRDVTDSKTGIVLKRGYSSGGISFSWLYALFVLMLVSFEHLTAFSEFYSPGESVQLTSFLRSLMICAFIFNCANSTYVCYRAFSHFEKFPEFCLEYDKFNGDNKCKFRRCVHIVTGMTWLCVMTNWALGWYALLSPGDGTEFLDVNIVGQKYVFGVTTMYVVAAWWFPSFFAFFICFILHREFADFNDRLRAQILLHNSHLPPNFEEYRRQFSSLCKLVSRADDVLHAFFGVSITMCSIIIIVSVYSLIWFEAVRQSAFLLGFTLFWTTWAVMCTLLICVSGGLVNAKAHEPLEYIHDIDARDMTSQQMHQLQLFLSKLNGPSIGLTAMRMVVVDRPMILTILGILLTYFIIIVELSPDDDDSGSSISAVCNCTETLL